MNKYEEETLTNLMKIVVNAKSIEDIKKFFRLRMLH